MSTVLRFAPLLLVLGLVVATGCDQPDDAKSTGVTFRYSGGIAGIDMTLEIRGDQKFRVFDGSGDGVNGTLGLNDWNRLEQLIARVDWQTVTGEKLDPQVADDFLFTLQRGVGTRATAGLKVNQTRIGELPAETQELITFLRDLADKYSRP